MSWLSGYKTVIGGVLHAVWFGYYVFIDKTIDTDTKWTGHSIIFTLTGTGLAHKAYKNKEKIYSYFNKTNKQK